MKTLIILLALSTSVAAGESVYEWGPWDSKGDPEAAKAFVDSIPENDLDAYMRMEIERQTGVPAMRPRSYIKLR